MSKENYKRLGDCIEAVKVKNTDLKAKELLGININKFFMPSVANVVGTDMSRYKVVNQNQFACNRMHVGRDYRIPIALSNKEYPFMVSPAYDVFEITKINKLNPEYLMMWFSRKEFDRNAWFHTDADVRGGLPWKAFCDIELPIPNIEKQNEIVKEYNTVVNRIKLNEQLNKKLEETAQAIYKHWFVDFEFPNEEGKPYKSSGGKMVFNEVLEKDIPVGWEDGVLGDFVEPINGYAFKSNDFSEKGEIAIIKIKNITPPYVTTNHSQFLSDVFNDNFERIKVIKGDILISMTGSGVNQMNSAVGQVGKYYSNRIALLNQRVCKLKPLKYIYKELVYQFIKDNETHLELLNGSTGSANQANISPPQIKALKIVISNNDIYMNYQKLSEAIDNNKRVEVKESLDELKELLLSKMSKL